MAHASHVLVVDDEALNRDMLSRRLERAGYLVESAPDGLAALQQVAQRAYDAVLLDVMMPGIDGVEVLRRIRESRSGTDLVVIMATAKDTREDVVESLKLGANDYVTKPLDFPVVLARLETQLKLKRAVDQIRAMEQNLAQRNALLHEANERMRRDLELAANVQRALLPHGPREFGGVRFAWAYEPCEHLAGDIFNVFPLDQEHVAFYLLDVSGHGVPAALLSVTLSRVLSPVPGGSSIVQRPKGSGGEPQLEPTPPAEVLRLLNQRFPMEGPLLQYFTLVYGVLHLRTREVCFASAAHPGPVHLRAGHEPKVLTVPSYAIGWDAITTFEETRVHLGAGDRFVLYSDGLIEAMQGRVQFGSARLSGAIHERRTMALGDALCGVVDEVRTYRGDRFDDDVSILALEVGTA